MNRLVLAIGAVLLLLYTIDLMPLHVQVGLFGAGVLLVGVPHGAADLLVGIQNAKEAHRAQSSWRFLSAYLGKLVFFGGLFYLFPAAGILFFFFMAAFHFGETDLSQFQTSTFTGRCFVLSYGWLIIAFILLVHVKEAAPLLSALGIDPEALQKLSGFAERKELILSMLLIVFFSATFIHFLRHPDDATGGDLFLSRLAALLILLYSMPLLLGFFFYFVVWHSVFSLANIVSYLRKAGGADPRTIATTIVKYTLITFTGIGALSFFFGAAFSSQTLIVMAFAALAVLTAPHMVVMHEMYVHLRKRFVSAT